MSTQQQIGSIIDLLERVGKRPALFIWPLDGTAAMNFVNGISVGARALGLEGHQDAWYKAIEKRGWQGGGLLPCEEMKARGMTDQEAVDEVVAIEIEAWLLLQRQVSGRAT